MNFKDGDVIQVKIGDRWLDTEIINGIQRLPKNSVYCDLVDAGLIDLNELAKKRAQNLFPFESYLDLYLNIGYSMCGFSEISSFEHLEIYNPLWEKSE